MDKVEMQSSQNLLPWKPTPTQLPENWVKLTHKLAQQAKSSPRPYVMDVRHDSQRVGSLLQSWGLPWQVVIAGYLWEYDKDQIHEGNLNDVDVVIEHITSTNQYIRFIRDENLPPLLTPPYEDLGALLIAVAIYYQSLQTLQEQSNNQPYRKTTQSNIERNGRTLLNIAKRLGMWHFKRDIEDLTEQLRSPVKFTEMKQEYERILAQDAIMLDDTRQWLMKAYFEATQSHLTVICTNCGITGFKRRIQDARTTATTQTIQLTGFDLVTFEVIVSTVQECYAAFGVLSQLEHINHMTDQIANPKPNGYSRLTLDLSLQPRGIYTQRLKWSESQTRFCNIQIATRLMHDITWYGCLYPEIYQLHIQPLESTNVAIPLLSELWDSEEGKVFFTVKNDITIGRIETDAKQPIVVYDKNRKPIALRQGATALDFAYIFDRMIGEHAVDAMVNNRKAPLYRILDAGDIVEIRTSSEIQAQDAWLLENYATIPAVRRQIKESLKRRYLDRRGYKLLSQELERYHYILLPEVLDEELQRLVKQHSFGSVREYLERLDKKKELLYTPEWAAQEIMQQIAERNELSLINTGRSSWVPVLDMQIIAHKKLFRQLRLCNFCQPTYPRDMKIMGRLRKQSGTLVVHKESCPHLIDHAVGRHSTLLPMTWQIQPPAFRVVFFLIAQDRKGLVLDLARQLRKHQCDLLSINAEASSKNGEARIRFTIEAYSDAVVMDIWHELYGIDNVAKVEIDASSTSIRIYDRLQKLRQQKEIIPNKTMLEFISEESNVIDETRNLLLDNPFDISRPAAAKMFFGRSSETEIMHRELCDGQQGKALIIYGPRRSGKSSICKNFLEGQVRPPYWSTLFSLQNAVQQNEETILMQLAEKVREQFSKQMHQSAPGWEEYSDADPQVRFRRFLQNCISQVPNSRLILALDEFGGVIESYEQQTLEYRFFTYWKDLINEIPQLSLVLALPTSSHNTLTSKKFVNVFSFAQPLPLTFLDTKSAQQLLVDPLREQNIGIHSNTVALALRLSGGSPYYMTLIGQQLIHYLNKETHQQHVADIDLRMIVDQLIEKGASQNFDFLREELQNNVETRILEGFIELTSRARESKVQYKKLAMWLNISPSIVRRHLDRLRIGLILDENGPFSNPYYSFKIELVRNWLTRNRWFFAQ
ncbi:MAG TPA: hypothetical protein DEV72_02800 [Ktedonobacter sp.]|nr:hypothetical protein [Ktedonobacter sp.]